MTVAFWGYNFVALKFVNKEMTPLALGLVRWGFSVAGMLVICWAIKVPAKVERQDARLALLQGFFSMGLYMVAFLVGASMTRPAEAAIILSTAPIFTALCAGIMGQEKINRTMIAWAALAMVGVSFVVLGGAGGLGEMNGKRLLGDLILLLSAVLWAVSATLSRPLVVKYSPFTVLTYSMWGALPVWLICGLVPTLHTDFGAMTVSGWSHLAFVVVCAGILGFVGFYAGVSKIGAPGAMLYQYCVPPLATIFSFLVLGTGLSWMQFLGFALVLFGVVMANRARALGTAPTVEPATSAQQV